MKVVLLQDVAKIGKKGEVATVPDGYALNLLIPKRMAEAATPDTIKRVAAAQADQAAAGEAAAAATKEAAAAIKDKGLIVTAEANESDGLFEALKAEAVVAAAANAGVTLKAEDITMEPIKELGEQTITIGDQAVTITVAKA